MTTAGLSRLQLRRQLSLELRQLCLIDSADAVINAKGAMLPGVRLGMRALLLHKFAEKVISVNRQPRLLSFVDSKGTRNVSCCSACALGWGPFSAVLHRQNPVLLTIENQQPGGIGDAESAVLQGVPLGAGALLMPGLCLGVGPPSPAGLQ